MVANENGISRAAARPETLEVAAEVLLVYPEEGHGLARLANRVDAYPKAAAFLAEVLRP